MPLPHPLLLTTQPTALGAGTLAVYSPAGSRPFPPLALGGAPAFAAASGPRLLLVSSSGALRLWDVPSQRCLLAESVAPLLAQACSGSTPVSDSLWFWLQ